MLSDWIYILVFNDAALIQQAIWFSNNILAKKKFKVIANACYTVGRRYKCILFIHFTLIESMLTSICIYMLECCWGEALWLAHTYLKVYIVCTFPEFPLSLSLFGLPSYYKLLFEVPVIFGKAILKVVIRDFSCHFRALWKYNSSSPL